MNFNNFPHPDNSFNDAFVDRCQARFNLTLDKDWSRREAKLYVLKKIKDGSIYDNLSPFYQEYGGWPTSSGGNYIPICQRRPSITYKLHKIIINASTSMLFGDNHFPTIRSENIEVNDFLQMIARNSNLENTMLAASKKGSIGSVVVIVKILNNKFWFESLETIHLHPVFDMQNPNTLLSLIKKIKIDGDTLAIYGYQIEEKYLKDQFYLKKEWTSEDEIYYQPYLVQDDKKENRRDIIDKKKSTHHGMGFVPAIWIKNLPDTNDNCIDGEATFYEAIDPSFVIDYQLSQHDRLLRYNSDPTLVIKNPSSLEGAEIIKGPGTLSLDEKGEAYLLEMSSSSTTAVIDYVRCLRELALESVRGDRANPDKISALHSGKALQMLNLALTSLVSEMRLTYGNEGLLSICKMILKICNLNIYDLKYDKIININIADPDNLELTLDWPDFYPKTDQDKVQESQALGQLRQAKILSQKSAIHSVADEYNIVDTEEEIQSIAKEQKDEYNLQMNYNNLSNKPAVRAKTKNVDRD